jgi:hypothetical protein
VYSRRSGLGIVAPPGPKPGTILDPAATLGWRPVYPGDKLVAQSTYVSGPGQSPVPATAYVAPPPDKPMTVTPTPAPPVRPVPRPVTPAPTPTVAPAVAATPTPTAPASAPPPATLLPSSAILQEPTSLVTSPVSQPGSPYNAPLVTQLPISPLAQFLLPSQQPLPGVALPDGSVTAPGTTTTAPAQAGMDPTTIALVIAGAVLLTMLSSKKSQRKARR